MHQRIIRLMIFMSIVGTLLPTAPTAHSIPQQPLAPALISELAAPTIAASSVPALPRGCIGTGTPIDPNIVCCVSGYVYRDGRPIDHAVVTIHANQRTITTTTQYTTGSSLPYFSINLYQSSLHVRANQPVTLTGTIDGQSKSTTFTAYPGGQQVDLVLPQTKLGSEWIRGDSVNPGRYGHGMAYDGNSKEVIIFGGLSSTKLLSDTWAWNGANWHQLHPATAPSGRYSHSMVYDSQRRRVVLFGGVASMGGGGEFLNDTWEWDGTTWIRQTPATSPPARNGYGMVYDEARSRVIVFGGEGKLGAARVKLNDMWEWNGTTWTQLASTITPPARSHHALAYDGARQRVVLFGGAGDTSLLNDTWEWDGSDWKQKFPPQQPPARNAHAMAYMPESQKVLLFGGDKNPQLNDTWEWNGLNWVNTPSAEIPARYDHTLAYDLERHTVVVFGGINTLNGLAVLNDVWERSTTTWFQRSPRINPPGRLESATAYDTRRHVTVLFGGNVGQGSASDETWEFDGISWTKRTSLVTPPRLRAAAMAYDEARQKIILFGGYNYNGSVYSNETWEWDGLTWAKLTPAVAPLPRSYHTMAYDSARQRIVLFGGQFSTGPITETWEWDGATWLQRLPSISPSKSGFPAMVYDTLHQRTILLTGRTSSTEGGQQQLWEWDGNIWTKVSTGAWSPLRDGFAIAYDSVRDRVIFFGGSINLQTWPSDVWEWDHHTWTQHSPANRPPGRFYHSLVYDPVQQNTVLVGGSSNSWPYFTDTWTWNGTSRTQIPADSNVPANRAGKALAYEHAGTSVLFGGSNGTMLDTNTYRWQGNQWLMLTPRHQPPGRTGHRLARNTEGSEVLLFGGVDGLGTYLDDTWLWDGTDWISSTLSSHPAPRANYGLTFDSTRGTWLLFGGQDNSAYFGDFWQYNGTAWSQIHPPGSLPPPRGHMTFTFDTKRQRAVLVGGQSTDGFFNDVWEWDGTQWWNTTPTQQLSARTDHQAAYDGANHVIVVAGGMLENSMVLSDTWQWDGIAWTERQTARALSPMKDFALDYDQAASELVAFGAVAGTYLHRTTGIFGNPPPVATISQLSPRDARQGLDTIRFVGRGMDADASDTIMAYRWRVNGVITSTAAVFSRPASAFALGINTIGFEVQDNEGSWSPLIQTTILIRDLNGGIDPNPSWTLLIYAVGDNDLAPWFQTMVERLQAVPGPSNVNIGVLFDGAGIDDTWRYEFSHGTWQVPHHVAEARMDDSSTLRDFILWGRTLQSDYYALALLDHANGAVGLGQDISSDGSGNAFLTPTEIRIALQQATSDGTYKLDVVQFDGCSFGLLEDIAIAQGQASIVIASPNTSWALFPYDRYRALVGKSRNPQAYAHHVVNTFSNAANYYLLPHTIAAYDLGYLEPTMVAVGKLGDQLVSYVGITDTVSRTSQLASIRSMSQIYDSGGSEFLHLDAEDSYIDLLDWTARIQSEVADPAVYAAATTVLTTTNRFIIDEHHRSGTIYDDAGQPFRIDLDHAHGLALYYPAMRTTSPWFSDYIQDRIFPITFNWGWSRFLMTALPESSHQHDSQFGSGLLKTPDPETRSTVKAHLFLPFLSK